MKSVLMAAALLLAGSGLAFAQQTTTGTTAGTETGTSASQTGTVGNGGAMNAKPKDAAAPQQSGSATGTESGGRSGASSAGASGTGK